MDRLIFKATRRKSRSCGDYRQIKKSGDLSMDMISYSDDGIMLNVAGKSMVIIDCDKKTGEFRLYVQ